MVLINIIVIVYLLATFAPLLTYVLNKIYTKKIYKTKVKKYIDIFVLLPAYKEQKIVETTVEWFRKFKYKGNIKFVIVTTNKEDVEYKSKGIKDLTTQKVVKNKLKDINDSRFKHIHYPKNVGNKSSQMNYALSKLKKDFNEDTFISVFDFDSKPELDTFENLNKVYMCNNKPDVINQVPLNIKNFEDISKKSIIMMIYTFQHLVRSIAIEKLKLLICSLTKFKIPQYCMGACMHIKYKVLEENNYFPIFVDDLTLGYRLSIKGYRFAYLPSLNLSLIPNNIKGYVGSATLIFKGICTYLNEILNIKGNLYRKIKMFIFGTFNVIEFIIVPFIFVLAYLYMIINLRINSLLVTMLLIPILWSISSYLVIRYYKIKSQNKFNLILSILLSPIWFIFRPLGFIRYYIKKIISVLKNSNIDYGKTER